MVLPPLVAAVAAYRALRPAADLGPGRAGRVRRRPRRRLRLRRARLALRRRGGTGPDALRRAVHAATCWCTPSPPAASVPCSAPRRRAAGVALEPGLADDPTPPSPPRTDVGAGHGHGDRPRSALPRAGCGCWSPSWSARSCSRPSSGSWCSGPTATSRSPAPGTDVERGKARCVTEVGECRNDVEGCRHAEVELVSGPGAPGEAEALHALRPAALPRWRSATASSCPTPRRRPRGSSTPSRTSTAGHRC